MSRSTFDSSEFYVIGATENPHDDEPLRLRPIVRSRTQPYRYGLIYENDDGDEVLLSEDEQFILDEIRAGRFFQLPCPILMQQRHWLLQLEPGRTPEYIAADRAPARLAEVAELAMRRCEDAVRVGDKERAREYIGYASVALPDDPFLVIARISLWRDDLSSSQLRWELEALNDFTQEQIEARFQAVRDQSLYPLLIPQILSDPLSETYTLGPSWIPKRPKRAPKRPSEFFGGYRTSPSAVA